MTSRRTVSVLGATGSVGRSTLDLIGRSPDAFDVVALTANRDVEGLIEISRAFGPRVAVIGDETKLERLRDGLRGTNIGVEAGEAAVIAAAETGADWTMASIVGCAGLRPVMAALAQGRTVALANKESLVSAGELMTRAAAASGARLLPVDSEHNAIFQCLDQQRPERVSRIVLTASGGPFRTWSRERMACVTPAEAVAHPNWSMGAKISVDSATLMNKGLELIEAYHLFPVGVDALSAIVHPQSVVHSLVEYVDGSVLAQLGAADMRIPIAHALAWPDRMETPCQRLDLVSIARLDFEEPDLDRFPALALAKAALRDGGAQPAILNAANEIAVAAFLESRLRFLDIASVVADVLSRYRPQAPETIDDVLAVDQQARDVAAEIVGKYAV